MKNISGKIIRYSSAAAALLAVSANAQARATLGKITGEDGNTILNHNEDFVYIDIDNDHVNEFLGLMFASTSYSLSQTYLFRGVLFGAYYGAGIVQISSSYTSIFPWIDKFSFNDMIGPISNSFNAGFLTTFSGTVGGEPGTPPPPEAPFNNDDAGYIGVGLESLYGTNYGWVQIEISPIADVNFIAAAMETELNTPIPAGNGYPVPLLPIASAAGLGLVGLMAALKRKKKNITI